MAAPKFSDEVRTFVVQALACFDAPSTVVKAVKTEFGLVITPQAVEANDPTKRAGRMLARKWRELFEATRTAFLEDTAAIGVSHRAVRLRALQRMAEKAEHQGNIALAANLLEQAAKESGEAYTNRHRHELTGKDGGPIQTQAAPPDLSRLTQSERDALRSVAERLAGGPEGNPPGA